MSRWLHGMAALVLLAACAGCSAPPPPPPTVVKLTLTATPDVNPTPSGQGAPVAVRVYQLASANAFGNAEFYQLFNHDQATLKADLVKRDDFILAPGKSKTVTLTPTSQVKALGFFAAYRDFQHAAWRADVAVPPHKTTTVTLTASRTGLVVKSGS